MGSIYRFLLREFPRLPYSEKFEFRAHTTVGIGGTAPIAIYPRDEDELQAVVRFLRREAIPNVFLGNGSNVLASDNGFAGVVVCTAHLNAFNVTENGIWAESGVRLSSLLHVAAENGFGGISFLAGIPATLGGALFMNAGAQGKFLSCCVRRVAALYRGEAVLLSAQECGFSYKKTRFMEGDWVVMAAELELPRQERNSVLEEVRSTLLWRRRLPRGKSMGCIFKNPPGDSAGRLIEKCGWKGASCGDAYVSEAHANFIINRANASSEDFKTLIRKIRESVLRNTGIVLSEEIRYIGES